MVNKQRLEPDPVLKDYWNDNRRFADLFNQVFFNGLDIIQSDMLSEENIEESAVIKEGKKAVAVERSRDVIKKYDNSVDLILIGLENQMNVHYAMPVRGLLYDALRYTRQCKEIENQHRTAHDLKGSDEFLSGFTKDDKIKPVMTAVIYYGEKSWDGPISLGDMMEIPDPFKRFFHNQQINLIQVNGARQYDFKNQDNQDFFQLINTFYQNNKFFDMESFRDENADRDVYWETIAAVGAVTGSTKLIDYAYSHKGGRLNMYAALENLEKQVEERGMQKGMQKGIEKGMQQEKRNIIINMLHEGFTDAQIISICHTSKEEIEQCRKMN